METVSSAEKLVNSWYDLDTETSAAVTCEEQEETEEHRACTLFRIYLNGKFLEDQVFLSSCKETFLSGVEACCYCAKLIWSRKCREIRDRWNMNRR